MDRKNGIDLFRLIGAFFIMALHTTMYGDLSPVWIDQIRLLARWAVPYFFLTTGFFIGSKIENETLDFKKIKNNIRSLITILIISSIIYLPIQIRLGEFSFDYRILLTSTHFHLWFIISLLFGYIFIWYVYFINQKKVLPYISICILLLALLSDSYDQLIGTSIKFDIFRFLLCIPFMYIGILFSKNKNFQISNSILIGFITLGLTMQFLEATMFHTQFGYAIYTHQFLIGSIITAIALFILSSKIDIAENTLTKWGKQHALFIYLYHPIVYLCMELLIKKINAPVFGFLLMFTPIIGFICILGAALLLNTFLPKMYAFLNGKLFIKKDSSNA